MLIIIEDLYKNQYNVETAKKKISELSELLEDAYQLSNIQFPIEEDKSKQFSHFTLNKLSESIRLAQEFCDDAKAEIEAYEKQINM